MTATDADMRRRFSKMHGLGNDFVLFDATREPLPLDPERTAMIADRRRGIGCDQILIVEPAGEDGVDFGYRIINADGSESAQCGNGARCFARFVRDRGLTDKDELVVATRAGRMRLESLADGQVRVEMGVPAFEPADVPIRAPARAPSYALDVDGRAVNVQALSIGNPHAVLSVDDVGSAPVAELGPALESHPDFPERVNVGFMEVVDERHLRVRVYERGVGETMACGSGACAAMVAGRLAHGLQDTVQIQVTGGILTVEWAGEGRPVYLTGPAAHAFDGELEL